MTDAAAPNDIRSRILQFTSLPVPHDVPELGRIYIRRITLFELDAMQTDNARELKAGEKPVPTTVRLLARFIGDEKGLPLFDIDKPADLDALLAFPVGIAADVLRKGNDVNNMEEKPVEKK